MVYARKLLLLRLLYNYAFCITQLAKFDFRCKITTFFSYTQPFERKKNDFSVFSVFQRSHYLPFGHLPFGNYFFSACSHTVSFFELNLCTQKYLTNFLIRYTSNIPKWIIGRFLHPRNQLYTLSRLLRSKA
jgi:hypothetical protein